jgi:hypothetical protein
MRGKKLLLICNAGVRSAAAALHLRERGVADAVSVRGGAQEYLSAVHGCSLGVLRYGDAATDAAIPAFHKSPMYEQWAAVGTFFGVKFIYSLIAAGIAIWLWRRREVDLSAIRWSMIIFFVGEACCFVNVVVFFEDSMLLEHLHSVGMVWSLGCAAYALLEGLDTRVIHFSDDSRCAAAGLCRLCAKHAEVGCGLRRLFLLLIPAMALTAALPLFSAYRVGVLHSYRHPIVHQFYELRYLPVVAIVLLAVCLVVLGLEERRSISRSKILFAAALGAMGFSFFRLVLVAAFVDNQVWFAAWEETTELLFVGVIAGVLILFARGLAVEEQPIENGKRT